MKIKTTSFHDIQIIRKIELPYLPIVNQILEGFLPYAYKFGTIYTLAHRGFKKCSGTNKLDTE